MALVGNYQENYSILPIYNMEFKILSQEILQKGTQAESGFVMDTILEISAKNDGQCLIKGNATLVLFRY